MERPAEVIQLWQIANIYWTAAGDEDPYTFHAKMILVIIVACVRHRHLARVTEATSPPGLSSFQVSRGKRSVKGSRPGFIFSLPDDFCPDDRLLREAILQVRAIGSEGQYNDMGLLPAARLGRHTSWDEATFFARPMNRSKC